MKFIELGKIVNTHGVHGEIKVNPYADTPAFLKNFKSVFVDGNEYKVKSVKETKGCAVLKLETVDTVETATLLRGKTVLVPESALPILPEGSYYIKDLIGMEVYADEDFLGVLTDVMQT